MKEMRLAMREVEVELPDEFGGYILTGATCYTTFPSCKMAVYATVSVELICFCSPFCNSELQASTGHVNEYPTMHFFGNPRRTRSIMVNMILTEYFENCIMGMLLACPNRFKQFSGIASSYYGYYCNYMR